VTGMPPIVERVVPAGAAAGRAGVPLKPPLKPLGGRVPGADGLGTDGLAVAGVVNPLGGAVMGAAAGLAETEAAGAVPA
jgi:hypothetical protein